LPFHIRLLLWWSHWHCLRRFVASGLLLRSRHVCYVPDINKKWSTSRIIITIRISNRK
jgi:hypothetical protein